MKPENSLLEASLDSPLANLPLARYNELCVARRRKHWSAVVAVVVIAGVKQSLTSAKVRSSNDNKHQIKVRRVARSCFIANSSDFCLRRASLPVKCRAAIAQANKQTLTLFCSSLAKCQHRYSMQTRSLRLHLRRDAQLLRLLTRRIAAWNWRSYANCESSIFLQLFCMVKCINFHSCFFSKPCLRQALRLCLHKKKSKCKQQSASAALLLALLRFSCVA